MDTNVVVAALSAGAVLEAEAESESELESDLESELDPVSVGEEDLEVEVEVGRAIKRQIMVVERANKPTY